MLKAIFALSFVSSFAFADCPKLNGTFECGADQTVKIEQSMKNNHPLYKVHNGTKTEEIEVDGKNATCNELGELIVKDKNETYSMDEKILVIDQKSDTSFCL